MCSYLNKKFEQSLLTIEDLYFLCITCLVFGSGKYFNFNITTYYAIHNFKSETIKKSFYIYTFLTLKVLTNQASMF